MECTRAMHRTKRMSWRREPTLPGEELKRNNTFPRNNREVDETNESREGLDYSVTYLLLSAFCYL